MQGGQDVECNRVPTVLVSPNANAHYYLEIKGGERRGGGQLFYLTTTKKIMNHSNRKRGAESRRTHPESCKDIHPPRVGVAYANTYDKV